MEKDTLQDLIFRYGILLGKRHSDKQKKAFLRCAKKQFEECGYAVDITKVTASFMKSEQCFYNLYAGDLRHADILITTYYDTELRTILPKRKKAFHSNYAAIDQLMQMIGLGLFLLALAVGIYFGILPHLHNGFLNVWGISLLIIMLAAFAFIVHARSGIAKRYNMCRNSSSIITMFQCASILNSTQKKSVAFAFLDEGTKSEYGLVMLKDYRKQQRTKQLYLDSVGTQSQLYCFSNTPFTLTSAAITQIPLPKSMKSYGDVLFTSGVFDGEDAWLQIKTKDDTLSEEKIALCVASILDVIKTMI